MVLHQVDFVAVMFDHWLEVVRNVIDEAGRSGLNEETVRALEQAAAETEPNFTLARPFLPGTRGRRCHFQLVRQRRV